MSLKQFQILCKLGSGSFGIVYKSRRKENNEIVVLKQVELKRMDKRMREWAMNQGKIMKTLNSPYIVKYYQSFTEKEKLYIVMEYCSGGDLCQYLRGQLGKPLSEQTIWRFTLQIMLGLRDLHTKKILHRDIKTMNVFLTDTKAVRIGDLGVARTMTGDFASTVVGTPYYLSPQMCEEKPYNEKTDVWAMGCLVYQLCTGRHPFEANTQAALALKIVVGKYTPIPTQYSQTLVWLVRLCLSVDYKRRPSIDYLLMQQSIVDLSIKYGISLDMQKQEVTKQTTGAILIKDKQKENPKDNNNKVEAKIQTTKQQPQSMAQQQIGKVHIVQKVNQIIKKNEPQKKYGSIQKIKQKSVQKQKEKVIPPKQIKKQYNNKPSQQQQQQATKYLPPKDNNKVPPQQQPIKKIQNKQKQNIKMPFAQPINHKQPQIKKQQKVIIQQRPKQYLKVIQKIQKKQSPSFSSSQQNDGPSSLLLQSKPRKSAQQLVDDDQLFKDFGITPQKLTTMGDKMDFKKVNTINWNVTQQYPQSHSQPIQVPPSPSTTNDSQFVQLPTIKTPSACQIVPVQCKQHDEEEVAEQMDDNVPYKSEDQYSISDKTQDDTLLIEDLPQIEQQGQLKRKQSLMLLQRKIFQNQKRKRELMELKQQYQSQILKRISKEQYQHIKMMIRQDKDVDTLIGKEMNGGNVLKLIKIYHYEIQIQRCKVNILKWREKIAEMK